MEERRMSLLRMIFFAMAALLLLVHKHMAMAQNQPPIPIRIACGVAGKTVDAFNREWIGDENLLEDNPGSNVRIDLTGGNYTLPTYPRHTYTIPKYAPFTAARQLDSTATYTIKHITPGRYFLRLYFVDSGATMRLDDVVFSVMLNNNIQLLTSVSLSDLIVNPKDVTPPKGYSVKEFIVNVVGPSVSLSVIPTPNVASISGIEFVPLPPNVFPSHAKDIRTMQMMALHSEENYTYETVHRYNVAGPEVTDSLGRKWNVDDALYLNANSRAVDQTNDVSLISYGDLHPLTAPVQVYMSARAMSYNSDMKNENKSLSWQFPITPGYPCVVRLHFCELVYSMPNDRVFDVAVHEKLMETELDVAKEAGGRYVAMVKDYHIDSVKLSSDGVVFLDLMPNNNSSGLVKNFNSFLNGVEIFQGHLTSSDTRRRERQQ